MLFLPPWLLKNIIEKAWPHHLPLTLLVFLFYRIGSEGWMINQRVQSNSACKILLCTYSPCTSASSSEKITIVIEPETGYAYIDG